MEVLEKMGYKPEAINGNEVLYKSPFRDDNNASLSFNTNKGVWVDFATGNAGKLVDLLMLIYKVNSVSEMLSVFNKEYASNSFSFSPLKEKPINPKKPILKVVSISEVNTIVLTKYLVKRGISKSTWKPYLKEVVLQREEKPFQCLAFKNDSGGYEVRNPFMKNGICIGNKDITTIRNSKESVLLFEGFFDFLSFVQLGHLRDQSVIVLNSVVNTDKAANELAKEFCRPEQKILLYLDNDEAGKVSTNVITNQFSNAEDRSDRFKNHKDLNEFLMSKIKLNKNKGMSM